VNPLKTNGCRTIHQCVARPGKMSGRWACQKGPLVGIPLALDCQPLLVSAPVGAECCRPCCWWPQTGCLALCRKRPHREKTKQRPRLLPESPCNVQSNRKQPVTRVAACLGNDGELLCFKTDCRRPSWSAYDTAMIWSGIDYSSRLASIRLFPKQPPSANPAKEARGCWEIFARDWTGQGAPVTIWE